MYSCIISAAYYWSAYPSPDPNPKNLIPIHYPLKLNAEKAPAFLQVPVTSIFTFKNHSNRTGGISRILQPHR